MSVPNYQNGIMPQNQFYGIPQTQPNQYAYSPQTVRPMMIPGRMITRAEEIMPNEVPMDGSVGLFYKSDMSCIYSKAWNSDGTIRTIKFVPYEEEANAENTKEETLKVILDKLNSIEKSMSKYNKPYQKPKAEKKEVCNRC